MSAQVRTYADARCSEGRAPLRAPALESSPHTHAAQTRTVAVLPAYASNARQPLLGCGDLRWHVERTALDFVRDLLHLGRNVRGERDVARGVANAVVLHGEAQRAAHIDIVNHALDGCEHSGLH